MTYPSTLCQPALEHLFRQHPPHSLLAIGADADAAFAPWQAAHPQTPCRHIADIAPDQADGLERHDVVLVANCLERLARPQAEQLVALLRDRVAERLLILLPIGGDWPGLRSHWTLTDMVALGLRRLACFEHDGRPLELYRFDLYDYKLTPDWLNPRFWANPQMWDKARW
ncbi:MAG: DUF6231 family protein [Gammaproteobacteria bacterium]|nr:DUF6231 family protein [Gammaproteobacteria bacterium]MDX5375024.1 DUF6231 family protein [Gammaproteobacteria bacterium]